MTFMLLFEKQCVSDIKFRNLLALAFILSKQGTYNLSENSVVGKFRNLALALLVWMYVKQQGADSKPAAPSLELRTTLNLTHGRHLPLASKIGWRYCPPLSLQCTRAGCTQLFTLLVLATTYYYSALLM